MTPIQRSEPECAVAAVLGGAVTRERLFDSASREGIGASPLVQALLAQSLPTISDLARAYSVIRLDASFLLPSPKAARLLDVSMLRRERCVPLEILDEICILAVQKGRVPTAVRAVRASLRRDVLPVLADRRAIDTALDAISGLPRGIRQGSALRRDSPVHSRFRTLILEDTALNGLPLEEDGA